MMKMMNCFCGMVDQWKAFSLISSRDHCQRSSPSRISDMPRAGFEPAQNLSSGLVELSCAVGITITPRRHELFHYIISQRIIPLYYLTKNYSTISSDKELLHYIIWQRILPLYYLTKNYSTILSDKELLHYIIWQRIIPLYYLTKNYSTILSDKELFTILPEKELFHYIFSERIIPLCYLTTNYSTMLSDT